MADRESIMFDNCRAVRVTVLPPPWEDAPGRPRRTDPDLSEGLEN